MNNYFSNRIKFYCKSWARLMASVVWMAGLVLAPLSAQTFDSGSDGSDGALNLTEPGTILFDPATFSPPLDTDGDGVYHFTSINIASEVTVRFSARNLGTRPVFWLATDDVQVDGTLDLQGEDGHEGGIVASNAIGGAGGFEGGTGSTSSAAALRGSGPGGGAAAIYSGIDGGGASHAISQTGSSSYGNNFLQPLLGGSGGGGGKDSGGGGGGGAGGGAILIASSTRITLNGSIVVDGGHGGAITSGSSRGGGGGGSGGAIRLVAQIIQGGGSISNRGGGAPFIGVGIVGRTRLEASQINFSGDLNNAGSLRVIGSGPGAVFPPENAATIRVVSIGGFPVPANPTGFFPPADTNIDTIGDVQLEIEANNVPLGSIVNLRMVNETEGVIEFDSTPLAGTEAFSTATASVTIPPGFSRFTLEASFTP